MQKEITVHELKKILDQDQLKDALLIDVRTKPEHKSVCIRGAKNIPLDELKDHKEELSKVKTLFVHCRTGGRSTQACRILSDLGLSNTINVKGGILEWQAEGFAVDKTKGFYLPLIQQVHLSAGSLVLLGSLLALFVDVHWAYLSAFVGAGLSFAGATGWCGMAQLLAKMPWNK